MGSRFIGIISDVISGLSGKTSGYDSGYDYWANSLIIKGGQGGTLLGLPPPLGRVGVTLIFVREKNRNPLKKRFIYPNGVETHIPRK
jgi:hypothetical protein